MTLRTVCQDALQRITGFEVPSSYYGNTNLTATSCVALVNAEGRALAREYRWSGLITPYTFTTVASTSSYILPADFLAFANRSLYDRANDRRMAGPTSAPDWQELQSSNLATGLVRFFRKVGNAIVIYPTPTVTGDVIAFDYYSSDWVSLQAGGTANRVGSDNDTFRLDEELLILGLKWRFLQAKGLPFEPEYKEYESLKEEARADDSGAGVIDLNNAPVSWDPDDVEVGGIIGGSVSSGSSSGSSGGSSSTIELLE